MRSSLTVFVALIPLGASAADVMRDTAFVAGFRELRGREVTIDSCAVAGTASDFIRCETTNGAASWALDTATMNRDDLRWTYETCPTGSRLKPACRRIVTGIVAEGGMPRLTSARFKPLD